MRAPASPRWSVVAVFFAFMLLHQSDKLLIGPLTTPSVETFGIHWIICLSTWALCALFFIGTAYLVPRGIAFLRAQMRERAAAAAG